MCWYILTETPAHFDVVDLSPCFSGTDCHRELGRCAVMLMQRKQRGETPSHPFLLRCHILVSVLPVWERGLGSARDVSFNGEERGRRIRFISGSPSGFDPEPSGSISLHFVRVWMAQAGKTRHFYQLLRHVTYLVVVST